MGKPSAPAPPDYTAAAEATGRSSLEAIAAQTEANRPNQYTPWGQSEWTQSPTGGWEQNITLAPDQQAALDAQMSQQLARSQLGESLTGRMADEFGQPMDWSQFQEMGEVPEAQLTRQEDLVRGIDVGDVQGQLSNEGLQNVDSSERYNQSAGDALYGRATSRLDPQWQRRESDTDIRLRNQGLRPGDEAYDRAMNEMNMERTDAYQQAGYGADIGAGQEASRMFGMDMGLRGQQFGERSTMGDFFNQAVGQEFGMNLGAGQFANKASSEAFAQSLAANQQNFAQQGAASNMQTQQRQQQIAEEMTKRGFSLNEMNAIMSGQQIGMPNMPNFQQAGAAQPTNYLGAAGMQYQGQLDQFGLNQAGSNALMGSIGSLAGGAMMMSDRRLKRDIKPVGVWNKIKFYTWTYIWGEQGFGVMADEVRHITGAVVPHQSGYDMVDYGVIYGR